MEGNCGASANISRGEGVLGLCLGDHPEQVPRRDLVVQRYKELGGLGSHAGVDVDQPAFHVQEHQVVVEDEGIEHQQRRIDEYRHENANDAAAFILAVVIV